MTQYDPESDETAAQAAAQNTENGAESAREVHLAIDLCLRVGEMLLASGAGAADVQATMRSVASHLGLRQAQLDVTFTALSMSYQASPDQLPVLMVRHVQQREIDYEDLTAVDRLVRDLLTDKLDLYLARSQMATIVSTGHVFPRWAVTVAWGVMAAAVGVYLGGGLVVSALAFVAAVAIDRIRIGMARLRLPHFYLQVAGGATASLLATGVAATPLSVAPSLVITATIIMLLAGIGLMGAVQDALTGFYITAGARAIEAMMATAGIIAGVAIGLSVAGVVGVELGVIDPGRAGYLTAIPVQMVGAAVAAAAFSVASYAPRRALPPVAVITAVASGIYSVVDLAGFGRVMAAGTAALFIGLVAYAAAERFRIPPLVVAVPAIVPLLPGLSIFRGLSLLADGGIYTSGGLLALMTAISVAIALASGVILGEYVAQPLKREARKLEDRLSGPRLVGPFRALTRAERRALRRQQREEA